MKATIVQTAVQYCTVPSCTALHCTVPPADNRQIHFFGRVGKYQENPGCSYLLRTNDPALAMGRAQQGPTGYGVLWPSADESAPFSLVARPRRITISDLLKGGVAAWQPLKFNAYGGAEGDKL